MSETCYRKHLLQFIKEQLVCFYSTGWGLVFYFNQPAEGNQSSFASLLGLLQNNTHTVTVDRISHTQQQKNSSAPPSFSALQLLYPQHPRLITGVCTQGSGGQREEEREPTHIHARAHTLKGTHTGTRTQVIEDNKHSMSEILSPSLTS